MPFSVIFKKIAFPILRLTDKVYKIANLRVNIGTYGMAEVHYLHVTEGNMMYNVNENVSKQVIHT